MDAKELHTELERMVLYPGSVDELNRMEEVAGSGKRYVIVPMEGPEKYLKGAIIPGQSVIAEVMSRITGKTGKLKPWNAQLNLRVAQLSVGVSESDLEGIAKTAETADQFVQGLMGVDIRMKARNLGADGLVHYQHYGGFTNYMGVPVKLVSPQQKG